jgi:hypothetical protein
MRTIREVIAAMFPTAGGAVPAQLSIEEALALLAEAKREEQAAQEALADLVVQLDAGLAASAMHPGDASAEKAADAADTAHRDGQLRVGRARALVRGVGEKLKAARAKKDAEDAAEYAAHIRSEAADLIHTCACIDESADLLVVHLQAALAIQVPLAAVHRDVLTTVFGADLVIKTVLARIESRLKGTSQLRHVAALGRGVAAMAVGSLPLVPAADRPVAADPEAA